MSLKKWSELCDAFLISILIKALSKCLAAVLDGWRVSPSTLRWSEISNRRSFPWWLGNMANGFAQGLSRHSLSIQFCSAFPTCQFPSGANSWTKMVCTFPMRSLPVSTQHLAPVLPCTSHVLLFLLAPLSFFFIVTDHTGKCFTVT